MGLSREQALDCFASDDLIGIGMEADAVRRALHPEGVVSYAIEAQIGFHLGKAPIEQAAEAVERGATGLLLTGAGQHSLEVCEGLLTSLKRRFPDLRLQGFPAGEALALAEASNLTLTQVFARLRAAGLDAIPGDGSGAHLPAEAWLESQRAAHRAGLPSTACLVFGGGESAEDRVASLQDLARLQEETGGFLAFSLASAAAPSGRELDDPTAVEYLKTLAICRMMLDGIAHVQADWRQQGLKVLQMGLRFGGNDAGLIPGDSTSASEEEIRRVIRDAGFRPARRDSLFRSMFLS